MRGRVEELEDGPDITRLVSVSQRCRLSSRETRMQQPSYLLNRLAHALFQILPDELDDGQLQELVEGRDTIVDLQEKFYRPGSRGMDQHDKGVPATGRVAFLLRMPLSDSV
jgi:hypothetical protein